MQLLVLLAQRRLTQLARRRLAQHFVNDVWARISTLLFYKVTVSPLGY